MKSEELQKLLSRLVEMHGELNKVLDEIKQLMILVSKEIK